MRQIVCDGCRKPVLVPEITGSRVERRGAVGFDWCLHCAVTALDAVEVFNGRAPTIGRDEGMLPGVQRLLDWPARWPRARHQARGDEQQDGWPPGRGPDDTVVIRT